MEISKKKEEVEKNFNTIKAEIETLQSQLNQKQVALVQIQGQYQLLTEMESEKNEKRKE